MSMREQRVQPQSKKPSDRGNLHNASMPRPAKGITHLKSAHGKPGSGVVTSYPDGLITYGGKLNDGRWLNMAVTADQRGAVAIGDTHGETIEKVCDELGLSKARIIGGRFSKGG
jgi:hypothetical protein